MPNNEKYKDQYLATSSEFWQPLYCRVLKLQLRSFCIGTQQIIWKDAGYTSKAGLSFQA